MDYLSLLVNLVIAIVAAVVASRLSLRGFYKQEIWLRKEIKYNQIIDSLNRIQRYYWYIIDGNSGLSETEKFNQETELREREYVVAKRDLEMLASSPLLMINPEVVNIINEFIVSSNTKTKEESLGNWFSYFDRLGYEAKEARDRIAEIAIKDLEIKRSKKKY